MNEDNSEVTLEHVAQSLLELESQVKRLEALFDVHQHGNTGEITIPLRSLQKTE